MKVRVRGVPLTSLSPRLSQSSREGDEASMISAQEALDRLLERTRHFASGLQSRATACPGAEHAVGRRQGAPLCLQLSVLVCGSGCYTTPADTAARCLPTGPWR